MYFLVGMKIKSLLETSGGAFTAESSRQGGLDSRAVEENVLDSVVGALAEWARGGCGRVWRQIGNMSPPCCGTCEIISLSATG